MCIFILKPQHLTKMKTQARFNKLESWRPLFLQTGLVIALAASLLAFEWKTQERKPDFSGLDAFDLITEDLVPVTVHKTPLPPLVKPQPVVIFKVVDNTVDVIGDVIIDAGDDGKKEILPWEPVILPEPVIEEPDFFRVVEQMPDFPGGIGAMQAWLGREIRYPELARQTGIAGTVHVGFIVDKDGRITQVSLLRGIGGGCDEEALRVVSRMPAWEPGKQRGKPVRVAMSIPVRFVLL